MKVLISAESRTVVAEISDNDARELGLMDEVITGYERVKKNGIYYFNDIQGNTLETDENDVSYDEKVYNNGNYFSCKMIAENNSRADKLVRQLRQWQAHNDKPITKKDWRDFEKPKFYIRYSYQDMESYLKEGLEVDVTWQYKDLGTVYFTTRAKAEEALSKFKDELLWYYTEYQQRDDEGVF